MARQERVATVKGSGAFAAAFQPSLDAVSAGLQAWTNDIGCIQAESVRFIVDRLNKDAGFAASLAACRRPEDMLRLQADGMQAFVTDYLHEGLKLASMAMKTGRRCLDLASAAAASER